VPAAEMPSVHSANKELVVRAGERSEARDLGRAIGRRADELIDQGREASPAAVAQLGRAIGSIEGELRSRPETADDRAFALGVDWYARAGYDGLDPTVRAQRILAAAFGGTYDTDLVAPMAAGQMDDVAERWDPDTSVEPDGIVSQLHVDIAAQLPAGEDADLLSVFQTAVTDALTEGSR